MAAFALPPATAAVASRGRGAAAITGRRPHLGPLSSHGRWSRRAPVAAASPPASSAAADGGGGSGGTTAAAPTAAATTTTTTTNTNTAAAVAAATAAAAAANPPPITYGGVQHAGVLVASTPTSLAWYTGLLGMADDTHLRNTALPFPGAFVRAGGSQIHLMELPNPDPVDGRPPHGGRDRHVAVTVAALEGVVARLDAAAWPYTMSASGRRALFVRDPDGNAVELVETPGL